MHRLARLIPALCAVALAGCSSKSSAPKTCDANKLLCGGECVSYASDPLNCGGCNVQCPAPQGGAATCVNGLCSGSCTAPSALCGAHLDGGSVALACTNTSTDPENCGGCGTVCLAQQTCTAGQCTNCAAGQLQCPVSGSPGTTQCKAVLSDNANCGGCGNVCGAGSSCQNGACVGAGLSNCGNADGGAASQVDLQNDRANCGVCGNACVGGEICRGGDCVPCGVAACGNVCSDTGTNPQNCGACGHACTGTQTCVEGSCGAPVQVALLAPVANGKLAASWNSGSAPTARVDSALPIQAVTFSGMYGSQSDGGPVVRQGFMLGGQNDTPTLWSSSCCYNLNTADAGTYHVNVTAYDVAWRPDAGDAALHMASQTVDVTTLAQPTAAMRPQVTLSSSAGPITGASAFLPLNGPPITISATVDGGTTATSIGFYNRSASTALLGISALDGGTTASVTVQPSDLTSSFGPSNVLVCPFDSANQGGPNDLVACSQTASTFNLFVGKLPIPLDGGAPLLTALADGGAPTIVFMGGADGGFPVALPANQLVVSSAGSPYPSTSFADAGFSSTTLTRAEVASAALATRADGTFIDRFDCASGSCTDTRVVSNGSFTLGPIVATTGKAMLVKDVGAYAGYLVAFPTGSAPVPAFSVNAAPLATPLVATQSTGAIVFAAFGPPAQVVQNAFIVPNNNSVRIAHPSLSTTTAVQVGPAFSGALTDFHVEPTGEIVWQYSDGGKTWVAGAFYDGSSPLLVTPPTQIATGAATPFGWTRVRPGMLVGVGLDASSVSRVFVIDLNKKKMTAPAGLFAGSGSVLFAVRNRQQARAFWAVSDDALKLLQVTQDAAPNDPRGFSDTIWLTDLANAEQQAGTTSLYSSPFVPPGPQNGDGTNPAELAPHFVHSAAGFLAPVGGPATALAALPAVVWGEDLSGASGSNNNPTFRPGRLFFALYKADTTPPVPVAVDQLALTYDRPNAPQVALTLPNLYLQETAAGAALFFLGYTDRDLYAVPLSAPGGSTAHAVRVTDQPASFTVREDKARMLVQRADGTLLTATLAAGQGAPALTQVAEGLPSSPPTFDPFTNSPLSGFTSDGDHAWYYAQYGGDLSGAFNETSAQLVIVDLTAKSRVNFGRVQVYQQTPVEQFCSVANGSAVVGITQSAFDQLLAANVFYSQASGATPAPAHVDSQLGPVSALGAQGQQAIEFCRPSFDGSEAGFQITGVTASSGPLQAMVGSVSPTAPGGPFFDFSGPTSNLNPGAPVFFNRLAPLAPATYSPFGGPYLDEYDVLALQRPGGGNFALGATTGAAGQGFVPGNVRYAAFKVWGEAASSPGGKGFPYIGVTTGFYPNLNGSTRTTEANAALLYQFDSGDPSNAFVMELPLPGKAPPLPPLP